MSTQPVDLVALLPPLLTFGTALVVLVTDLAIRDKRPLLPLAVLGTLAAAGVAAGLGAAGARATFCTRGLCSYADDRFAVVLQLIVLFATVVVLLLAGAAAPAEHHFLLLSAVTGAVVLASARDLLVLVVALETLTIPTIVLVALRRADPRSSEAALKFFLVSVVSLALTLLGASLLYGVTGSLQFGRVAAGLAHAGPGTPLARVAVTLVLAGFAFKIAAVPFHAWAPDTYEGGPVPIATFLSVASKTGGFAGLLVVVVVALRPFAQVWGPVLAALAALTVTTGNLVALRQRQAVRLLAWSSIAQAGYVLAPLGVASTVTGRGQLADAVAATTSYLAFYAAMNLGAFACLVAVARWHPGLRLADLRGLAHRRPWLAVALAFFLFCLAGLPPGIAGLFAKVVVFRALVAGHVGWLVVVVAVNTVIGLYYYAAFAFSLFVTDDPAPAADASRPADAAGAGAGVRAAVALTAVVTIALSIYPQLAVRAGDVAGLLGR